MPFTRKRIIIADDSQAFIMYMAVLLTRMGFNVIPAENGLEVLKSVRIIMPDLIILDVYMSPMDGITTLQAIKGDKQISHIPVVMVSVDHNKEIMERCKSLGSSDYLIKPIKIDEIHDIIQNNIFYPLGRKRSKIRARLNKIISVIFDGKEHDLFAETISANGIYIRKKDPFPVGSEVTITLSVGDTKSLLLRGTVIYLKGLFGDIFTVPPGMAVEFKEMSTKEQLILDKFVKRLIAEDIITCQEEPVIKPDNG